MIRIIGESDLGEYDTPDVINYSLCEECKVGSVLSDITPSKAMREFWENSEKDAEAWELIAVVLKKQIAESRHLRMLKALGGCGKEVNVICRCKDYKHCVRGLLAEQLAAAGVEMFVR